MQPGEMKCDSGCTLIFFYKYFLYRLKFSHDEGLMKSKCKGITNFRGERDSEAVISSMYRNLIQLKKVRLLTFKVNIQ